MSGIAYCAFGCRIVVLPHAIQRISERFGATDKVIIPNLRMVRACAKVEDGEEFHVRTMLAKFVCKRESENNLVVVTVLYSL